mgnify:CR=1 FL=1|jgi:lysozyme|tara:strand:- start:141 stop:563 length:423 start_codon:yes stop_codon:yes gene_type:complete
MNVIDLIKFHEGYKQHVYLCSENVATIGYGHVVANCGPGLSKTQAERILLEDLQECYEDLERDCVYVRQNDVRKAVLLDMRFNLGYAGLKRFKKFRAALIVDNFELAANEMLDSRWARQVKTRAVRLSHMVRSGEWPKAL